MNDEARKNVKIRMTNEEARMTNDETRMTKQTRAHLTAFCFSCFGFLSSFVIRISSFLCAHQADFTKEVGGSAAAVKKRRVQNLLARPRRSKTSLRRCQPPPFLSLPGRVRAGIGSRAWPQSFSWHSP